MTVFEFIKRYSNGIVRRIKALPRQTAAFLIKLIPERELSNLADTALRLRLMLQERIRQLEAEKSAKIPEIVSWDGEILMKSVLQKKEPWSSIEIIPCEIPSMLTTAIKQYYTWIGKFYSGAGEVLEIGTWLGSSTFYIVQGLLKNPKFNGKIFAFDDFTWRSAWMDKWLKDTNVEAPRNHESFEYLFLNQIQTIQQHVVSERKRLNKYQGNEHVAPLNWAAGPIEICFIDVGRTLSVNEAWYNILSPHFIPNKTLIIMEDWGSHKRVPEVWWENTKIFTDSKGDCIELVHEVCGSAIATFLFRGFNG